MKLILKNRLYNEHYPSILISDFFGETEHFNGKNEALRWSIFIVGKQKHNVQKPSPDSILAQAKIWPKAKKI